MPEKNYSNEYNEEQEKHQYFEEEEEIFFEENGEWYKWREATDCATTVSFLNRCKIFQMSEHNYEKLWTCYARNLVLLH
nr:unnamed protein product [Meloidogyne enterolobii]